MRGPEARKGLPFFPPNALSCLYGEYLIGESRLSLYYSREPVVLSAGWKPFSSAELSATGLRTYLLAPAGQIPVLLASGSSFGLFFIADPSEPRIRRFAAAFLERFGFFFENAQSDAELSFPASVDFKP